MAEPKFRGLVPYLHYDDAAAMSTWLGRVFGFKEKARWPDAGGRVRNLEMTVGDTEVWLDGDSEWWKSRGRRPDEWIGVWVDDVDAMYERIRAAGVACEPPVDRPFGVRMLNVKDPEGYSWGFMRPL